MDTQQKYEKIFFKLKKDSTGYPPDDWETLWAYELDNGSYSIDSIPFFVRGIAWKDEISIQKIADEYHFDKLINPSGHSVLRVIVDPINAQEVRDMLQKLGCDTEQSHLPNLFSVDVPPTISLKHILELLKTGEDAGRWEYEEACLGVSIS